MYETGISDRHAFWEQVLQGAALYMHSLRQADAAAYAEARSGGAGGLARRSMKRASLMGARAGLTLGSVTQQLRRHSGDIHMLSHTLWAGACTHACTLSPLPLACLMVYS